MAPRLHTNNFMGLTTSKESTKQFDAMRHEWQEYKLEQSQKYEELTSRMESMLHSSACLINMYQHALKKYVPDWMETSVVQNQNHQFQHQYPVARQVYEHPSAPEMFPRPSASEYHMPDWKAYMGTGPDTGIFANKDGRFTLNAKSCSDEGGASSSEEEK